MRELTRRLGPWGLIRVLECESDGAREYRIGASVQTKVDSNGVSCFGYVHALKLLLRDTHKVLLAGGGGASLATMLARKGHDVTVIDIDPAAEGIARNYFFLDGRVRWVCADAKDYLGRLDLNFDAVVIDACDGVGLVSPFWNARILFGIVQRACANGVLLVNLVNEGGAPSSSPFLARRLAALGLHVTLHSPDNGWEGNDILQVSIAPRELRVPLTGLEDRPSEARTYLMSLRTKRYGAS